MTRVMSSTGNPINTRTVTDALLAHSDGATVWPSGQLYTGSGIVVALPEYGETTEGCGDGSFRTHTVAEWVERVAHAVIGGQTLRPRAFGVWADRYGDVYLDVVEIFPDDEEDAAVAAGRARNQIAVWHAGRGEEIPTGGTGEVDTLAADCLHVNVDTQPDGRVLCGLCGADDLPPIPHRTEHLCDEECGDETHPRDGRITLI